MNTRTLIWGALKRHKARTIFTFLSVVVAFVLFCMLAAVRQGMQGQLAIAGAERLNTYNTISQGAPMPLSYYNKIVTVPGVEAVTYINSFPGYFKDQKNAVRVVIADVQPLLQVYPEFILPAPQKQAWFRDQQGVIAGPDLVKRMGWKVGDTIPIQSTLPHKDGSTTWYFHLSAIYHADLPTFYQDFFVGHFKYVQEGIGGTLPDQVGEYIERVADPRDGTQVSSAIDKLFANSTPQTLTQPEVATTVSAVRQFGDVTAMVIYVGIAVFFTMLLIIANTVAQSVRERTAEFAMFRALGFKRLWLALLVLQESLLLVVAGGIVGLILGYEVTHLLAPTVGNVLQTFGMTWNAAGVGILLSIIFGLLAALVPVQRITRLRVADALRRA